MKWHWIGNFLIGVVLAFGVFSVVRILVQFHLFDFAIYYRSVDDVKHGMSMYSDTTIAMKYPMTAVMVLWPIGWLPYMISEKLWTIWSLLFLAIALFLLAKLLKKVSVLQWVYFVCFIVLAFPYKFTLGMGQINFLILASLTGALYTYLSGQKLHAAFLIALAAWIKLTPMILLLYFWRKREYKLVAASIVFYVLGWVLTAIFWGTDYVYQFFAEVAPSISTLGNNVYYNQAFTGLLARMHVTDSVAGILNYAILFGMLGISYFLTPKIKTSARKEILVYGLYIISMLLAAGLAWQHHFVWLIIPFAGVYVSILEKQVEARDLIVVAASYLMIAGNIGHPEIFVGISSLLLSHVTFGALILWLFSIKLLKRRV